MDRPKLTAQDLARIDTAKVKAEIDLLRKVVDSMGYIAPECSDVWQEHLDLAARQLTTIADGLRLTPPRGGG